MLASLPGAGPGGLWMSRQKCFDFRVPAGSLKTMPGEAPAVVLDFHPMVLKLENGKLHLQNVVLDVPWFWIFTFGKCSFPFSCRDFDT